ncbi:TonB-dependent receptor plug domain-containing protein [Psychroflexus planctonicus]|uniref:TonB-dependent receptor plug domain-containing protein n=1 Tax=Psychroflexus planctonicus TaxID=1526575 RepID=A0ABQ1SCM8_9FLAO|nr:TonB-dependent receptor plug domain-containing protein [Psychroflexus planctonicus]GGE27706.1 hypothetical protein GCM10010832_05550 [Psychroflexus planctonicus]
MRLLVFTCFFLIQLGNPIFAQKSYSDYVSLTDVFEKLNNEYQVDFSYSNQEIDGISIEKFDLSIGLKPTIEHLQAVCSFNFEQLPNQIIAVVLKPEFELFCLKAIHFEKQIALNQVEYFIDNYKISNLDDDKIWLPISKNKNTEIYAKAKGFEKKIIDSKSVMEKECYELYFLSESINLDEVIITNYLTKGINKMKSGQIRFMASYFGALPGLIEPDVLQSIQALPGVMSTEESVSYLNVRGGTHDQNLFLWDGIKLYQTSHFFGMITALNPYMTQTTDIIKNASNSEFGDGVSSVINMKTNPKINQKLKAEAGVNLIHADFFVDTPIQENSSLQISGRQSINQLIKTPTYDEFFNKVFQNTSVIAPINNNEIAQDDDFSFNDFSFRWLYQLSKKDLIRINGLFANDEFSLNRQEFGTDLISSRESNLDQQNSAFGAFYQRDWNKQFTSSFQFYTSNYQFRAINTDVLQAQTLIEENQVEEWGFKLKNTYQLNSEISFVGGYQFNETGILNFESISNPFFRRSEREAIITNSLFLGVNYQPTKQTNLNIGSRLNHISKFNSLLFEPRINFSHRFFKHFIFEFKAEQKSQITSQIIDQQSDFLGVESRRWVLANPDEIPVITSEQLSFGLSYQKNNWLITSDFYYKRILDITSQSQGFQNQFQFETTQGNYEVFGAEFLINKKWNQFSTWLSYSLSDNKYYFEDFEPQEFANNLDITHVIDLGINYSYENFNIATGLHWHSGLPTTPVIQNTNTEDLSFTFGNPNTNRLRNFFRVDFSANYEFTLKDDVKMYMGMSIWNVLGRNNVYNSFYSNPNHSMMSQSFQQGLGFTPNFSLRIQF